MAQTSGTGRRSPARPVYGSSRANTAQIRTPYRPPVSSPASAYAAKSGLQAAGTRERAIAARAATPAPTGGARRAAPAPAANARGNVRAPAAPPSIAAGPVPAVAAAPAIPDIETFLGGDVGYQGQKSQFAKALADFLAGTTRRRGETQETFKTARRELGQERDRSLENIKQDFASRGLLSSGLFGQANADYEKEFLERGNQLGTQETSALAGITGEETGFRGEQAAAQEAARQEAIRRRAEQYGV